MQVNSEFGQRVRGQEVDTHSTEKKENKASKDTQNPIYTIFKQSVASYATVEYPKVSKFTQTVELRDYISRVKNNEEAAQTVPALYSQPIEMEDVNEVIKMVLGVESEKCKSIDDYIVENGEKWGEALLSFCKKIASIQESYPAGTLAHDTLVNLTNDLIQSARILNSVQREEQLETAESRRQYLQRLIGLLTEAQCLVAQKSGKSAKQAHCAFALMRLRTLKNRYEYYMRERRAFNRDDIELLTKQLGSVQISDEKSFTQHLFAYDELSTITPKALKERAEQIIEKMKATMEKDEWLKATGSETSEIPFSELEKELLKDIAGLT